MLKKIILFLLIFVNSAWAEDFEVDFIPVPVFETRPDRGNTYGLMPVFLLADKESKEIKAILGGIIQYNDTIKWDVALIAYLYPKPKQEIQFYTEWGQHFSREVLARFVDSHLFEKIYLESQIQYLKTPFGFFYGLGAQTSEAGQTNYTSENFLLDLTAGFYLKTHLRIDSTFKFHLTKLGNRAKQNIADTLTTYGALPQVSDSTNWMPGIAFVFDNRADGSYSQKGSYARLGYSFSLTELGSDKSFHGWDLEALHIQPLIKNQWSSVFRLHWQKFFGDEIPFYELASLGGPNELRSFIPGRFVDQGKIIFQMEQRLRLVTWRLFGHTFDIYVDPFFEVGRVYNELSNLDFNHWQPVGGVGLRLFVPPNVVGRLDFAFGSEGFEMYTALGYPF